MTTPNPQIFLLFAFVVLLHMAESQPFDHFWFVQQWPYNFCALRRGQCVGRAINYFTIHGLWPQKGRNSVINCQGTSFDPKKISHLENGLKVVWPSLINGKNESFWIHEWNKHGMCSESKFDEVAYFQTSINLMHSIDLVNALAKEGIVPNRASKSKQSVESAVTKHFKKNPVLRCGRASNGQVLLTEIVMCIDKDGVTLIECDLTDSNCISNFNF